MILSDHIARLIEVGDLDSIYRRMTVIAYEDIGFGNPAAVDSPAPAPINM